ncbi:MAG TPA: TonB-dependent receptor plug domain-containing protein [Gemmatimonadaceae bacterium]|nr:TonB-dependent receptor plug domain-containing protein [Gemmatimonadaceae bacterium]
MIPALQTRAASSRRLLRVGSLVLAIGVSTTAQAEPTCTTETHIGSLGARVWPAPLDRLVSLHNHDLALRDALDRLAAAARLRISYSAELVPLDRRVCVSYDSVAAGAVLADLLDGSMVSPVVAGDDQVVLAPAPAQHRSAATHATQSVNVLDRVLVTSTASSAPARVITGSSVVIDRAQLARQNGSTLSETLNGVVPGLWVWDQAPSSIVAHYGSLRGASSFQVSYPKVYIDGIEVANPLLLTEMSPDAIERVEVIRGPQGAALYGADAIGGVVNIIMRHDGAAGEPAQIRGSAGVAHSTFATGPVLVQEHALNLRAGDDIRSSALSLSVGSVGSYVPGGGSWDARGDGGFRLVGARSMVTGTARFYTKEAGQATNPLIATTQSPIALQSEPWRDSHSPDRDRVGAAGSPSASQSIREYTLGSTASLFANETWTHALTVGLDGYRLSGDASSPQTGIPGSADSALRAARGSADRATLRASSEGHFGSPDGAATTVSVAAEHSVLSQRSADASLGGRFSPYAGWQASTGFVGRVDASWRGAFFATGGLRLEHDAGLAGTGGLVSLPMVGGAVLHQFGLLTTKLRASYGRSIRPAGSAVRASWLAREAIVQGTLAPEEQSGVEVGVDASIGRSWTIRVTRFDQTAYNLIQSVAITSSLLPGPGDGHLLYALQNVGEIGNRGWELESGWLLGRLSVSGSYSVVDSRIRRLAYAYSGDLRPGDRMLGIPARTGGVTATWTTLRWSSALGIARASDWIGYDGLALATGSGWSAPVTGAQLRDFWRTYPGVTRVDLQLTRQLVGALGLTLSGRNLLDVQRGEPDDLTVLPGRTLTAGLTAKF